MSKKKKTAASSDVYTAILALATCVAASTAGYIAYICYTNYGSIFQVVEAIR